MMEASANTSPKNNARASPGFAAVNGVVPKPIEINP
jgi:hypothetical protein